MCHSFGGWGFPYFHDFTFYFLIVFGFFLFTHVFFFFFLIGALLGIRFFFSLLLCLV